MWCYRAAVLTWATSSDGPILSVWCELDLRRLYVERRAFQPRLLRVLLQQSTDRLLDLWQPRFLRRTDGHKAHPLNNAISDVHLRDLFLHAGCLLTWHLKRSYLIRTKKNKKNQQHRVGIGWCRSETAECVITSGHSVAPHLNGLGRGLQNEDADALLIAILVHDNERTGKARG